MAATEDTVITEVLCLNSKTGGRNDHGWHGWARMDLDKLSSWLLVLAQKSSRLMTSDSLEVSPASLTMVTALFWPKGGLARTML